MSDVIILMATFNGEKYIKKQIESIINQSFGSWRLIVRDDGSKDSTVSILRHYSNIDDRIQIIENSTGLHGWQRNFQYLLHQAGGARSKYFMFCDQDDIWLPNKVETFFERIRFVEGKGDTPAVVYGNMSIINENDEVIHKSFQKVYDMRLRRPTDSFFSQRAYGCTMIFNKKVLDATLQILGDGLYDQLSHDGLIVKVCALLNGKVQYIEQPLIYYRRTTTNATASQKFAINKSRVLKAIKNIEVNCKKQASTYNQSILVIDLAEHNLSEDKWNKCKFIKLRKAILCGGALSIPVFMRFRINCGGFVRTCSHMIALITNAWM